MVDGVACMHEFMHLWVFIFPTLPSNVPPRPSNRADKFEIIAEGEGSDDVPRDESNLVVTGMKAAFAAAGKPMPTLKYHCINRIPYARWVGACVVWRNGGVCVCMTGWLTSAHA